MEMIFMDFSQAWSMWNSEYYKIVDTKQRNSFIVIIIRPGLHLLPFWLNHGPKQIVPYRPVFREESKIQD